jgi:hypothetical protein
MKNGRLLGCGVFGSCKETEVSEERIASIFRVEEIMRASYSETSVYIKLARLHIPEDGILKSPP